jgi:hypothetical protein
MTGQRVRVNAFCSNQGHLHCREQSFIETFLVISHAIVGALEAPDRPNAILGRRPRTQSRILRMFRFPQWFDLSYPHAEDGL